MAQRFSSRPPEDDAVAIGTVLEGRYRIVGELGSGGIGRVFRAEHVRLGHHVAVKVLQPRFLDHPQFRPRFEREARALARLAHPHIVAWTDYSIANGFPYLVMEVLSGRPLKVDIAQGPMDPVRARKILRQILGTLVYAHRTGFVHRDLKPGNVFLLDLPGEPDFVKVLDFGFVKLLDVESGRVATDQSQLTVSGVGIGTPSYMSPEQAAGDTTGAASDLYSLGIICYELVTGKRPFKGDIVSIMRQQMTDPLPSVVIGALHAREELTAFLTRATAKRPSERFASAQEMLDALDAIPLPWLVDPEAKRRSFVPDMPRGARLRWAFGILLFLLLALFVLVAVRAAPSEAPPRTRPSATGRVIRQPLSQQPPRSERASERAPRASSGTASAQTEDKLGPSPFDTRPRTPVVWNAHRAIVNGEVLSLSTEESLERFAQIAPGDPRPALLLAANAVRRHREDRAIAMYAVAYRVDASARNDPRMLRNLVRLVTNDTYHRAASEALAEIFGPLAREALDAELARDDISWASRERLIHARSLVASE